ncbi:MAG: amino acid ABC transporter ATP-binding protein [Clostridiaceae bacterium]
MNQIELKNIHKYFDGKEIIKGVDLTVQKGEILTFIGPSGGGKSTLLRCINLLENYEEGEIFFNGQNIKDRNFSLEKYRQKVGMIFQRFNLFGNLNVLDNLNVGQIKVLGRSKDEATIKSKEVLAKVGMADFEKASVKRLSGGQMQRVAIARALSMDPEVILLDEPTSALDPQMVDEVLAVIRSLADTGITLIIVTHEMRFAKEISHRIIFLKDGMLREEGTPDKIFTSPDSEEMQLFLKKYLEDRI